jgi:hypothetical protein
MPQVYTSFSSRALAAIAQSASLTNRSGAGATLSAASGDCAIRWSLSRCNVLKEAREALSSAGSSNASWLARKTACRLR